MQNKLVAGTVILNEKNGGKRFLLHENSERLDFIMASIDEERTSLACILEALKNEAHVDLEKISLVELTNIQVAKQKIPFYVFEIEEEYLKLEYPSGYKWELPCNLRKVLSRRQVTGVPIFN
ncbi:hypothetical protein ACWN8V_12060 [Vagococcus elongatus]|uniref:Uncharacterized protein n=1 Tax=Vagococcus elongatus TaxID=180344 RepID=A0A430AM54_9ENTE|nr:hypothetical protein [Vagococcus elongatus]RSU09212.1 hypothetical protein CBF29_12140 [Vagococcus elongatus]